MTATFTARTFQNEYVPIGATTVDAIINVAADGGARGTPAPAGTGAQLVRAVVIVIDTSASMATPRSKIKEARRAAVAAVEALDDGVLFAVVAGSHQARMVYPEVPALVPADETTRGDARSSIDRLSPIGGTAMSTWLSGARALLDPFQGAIRQTILLTDGRNETEQRAVLDAELQSCEGVFQCDCRGVGTDWSVEELRSISTALLGTVDIVARPQDMAADFEAIVRRTMARQTADVVLRIWAPRGAAIRYVKQVAPAIADLTSRAVRIDDRTVEVPTGAWGTEERDYHIGVSLPAHEVGDEMLAARVGLVVGGEIVAQSLVRAIWSDDLQTSTTIEPRVAHYTGQEELAVAVRDGLAARAAGDEVTATRRFGRAAQLAHASGHDGTMQLLARVVDVEDATTGTVRLRRSVAAEDEMALDTRSTATVRVRRDR